MFVVFLLWWHFTLFAVFQTKMATMLQLQIIEIGVFHDPAATLKLI